MRHLDDIIKIRKELVTLKDNVQNCYVDSKDPDIETLTERAISTFENTLNAVNGVGKETFLYKKGIKIIKQIQHEYVRHLRDYKTKMDTNSSFSTIKKELLDYLGFFIIDIDTIINENDS